MIQPTSNAFKYGPFRAAFIFSIFMLTAWITLFILTMQYCQTNCYNNLSFTLPCNSNGELYCCSLYNSSGYYSCGFYNSCLLDNTACGGFSAGSWVAGSLLLLSLVLMCFTAMKFRKMKQLAMMNAQNNGQWGYIHQNYNNPPVYYPNQQNPNPQYLNNQYPNHYQNQQNQANYAPPSYYNQN